MGFGYALNESQRLFLVVLHLLTDLTWSAIARAYSVQFPVPPSQPSTGDCRTQWSRKLQSGPLSRALEAGQVLPPNEDALARAYMQAHGLQSLNALGQAYLNAPRPPAHAVPAVSASVPPVPTAPIAPPQPPPPLAFSAAPLPTNPQAPADTTILQTAHNSYFWLSGLANYSQEAWDAEQALQDVLDCQGGCMHPEAGEERPVEEEEKDEETSFGGGPYGGYNYPSP